MNGQSNAELFGSRINTFYIGRQGNRRKFDVHFGIDVVVLQHHIVTGSDVVFRVFVNKYNIIAAVRICDYAADRRFARQRFFYGQILFGSGLRFFRTDVRINVCVRIGIPHFHVLCGQSAELDLVRGDRRGIIPALGIIHRRGGDGCLVFRLIGILFARRKSWHQHQHREHEREDLLHFFHIWYSFLK